MSALNLTADEIMYQPNGASSSKNHEDEEPERMTAPAPVMPDSKCTGRLNVGMIQHYTLSTVKCCNKAQDTDSLITCPDPYCKWQ